MNRIRHSAAAGALALASTTPATDAAPFGVVDVIVRERFGSKVRVTELRSLDRGTDGRYRCRLMFESLNPATDEPLGPAVPFGEFPIERNEIRSLTASRAIEAIVDPDSVFIMDREPVR